MPALFKVESSLFEMLIDFVFYNGLAEEVCNTVALHMTLQLCSFTYVFAVY